MVGVLCGGYTAILVGLDIRSGWECSGEMGDGRRRTVNTAFGEAFGSLNQTIMAWHEHSCSKHSKGHFSSKQDGRIYANIRRGEASFRSIHMPNTPTFEALAKSNFPHHHRILSEIIIADTIMRSPPSHMHPELPRLQTPTPASATIGPEFFHASRHPAHHQHPHPSILITTYKYENQQHASKSGLRIYAAALACPYKSGERDLLTHLQSGAIRLTLAPHACTVA